MTLFDPKKENREKEVDVAEISPADLEETMGASAYTGDYGRATELIENTEHNVVELQELCDRIFRKSRFTRTYVSEEEYGYPYLTPTNFGSSKPWYRQINNTEKGYISKRKHDISEYNVDEGWIMITCSGSVNLGSVFLSTEFMTDHFLTHDMIRVVPKETTLEGYLYAYLDSWVGRSLMLHNEFGLGVDHIEPDQLKDLPVILLPREEREEIDEKVIKSYQNRENFLNKNKTTVESTGRLMEVIGGSTDSDLEDFSL